MRATQFLLKFQLDPWASTVLSLKSSVLIFLLNLEGSSLIAKAPTKSVMGALLLQPWRQVVSRNEDVHTVWYS